MRPEALYIWAAQDRDDLPALALRALAEGLPPPWRAPGVGLSVAVAGPWRPDALLRGAPAHPPLLRLISLEVDAPRGRVLIEEARQALLTAPLGPVARGGGPWPEELIGPALSRQLGALAALAWSEAPAMAWGAVLRQGRCLWSEAAWPERQVRFDGEFVVEVRGHRDRADVIAEALARLLHGPVPLDEDERLTLPDLLAEAMMEAEVWTLD